MLLTHSSLACVALAALTLTACSGVTSRAYVGYFQPTLRGQFSLQGPGGTGQLGGRQNDLERDLGVEDPVPAPYLKAEFTLPVGRVTGSAFWYDESGTSTLGHDFGVINAGQSVRSDMTMSNLKLGWLYDVVDTGVFRVSPGLGVDWFDVDLELTAGNGSFEELSFSAPVPMVYVQGEVDLGSFAVNLDVGAMDINLPDGDGTYWDLEGMVRFTAIEKIELFAGYRFAHIEADGATDDVPSQAFDASLQLDGWFIGGGIVF